MRKVWWLDRILQQGSLVGLVKLTGREKKHVVALLFGAGTKVSRSVRRVLLLHLTDGAVVVVQHDAVQRQRWVVAERLDGESRLILSPAR